MRRRIAVVCTIVLAVFALPQSGWGQTGWTKFTTPDGSFSVLVPGAPEGPKIDRKGAVTHGWVARASYGGFVFAHGDYSTIPDVELELKESLRRFLETMKGSARAQRRVSFKAARCDLLPGLDFSHEGENVHGRGRIVVDGARVYMLVSVIRSGEQRDAESARFLNSLAIAAPARR